MSRIFLSHSSENTAEAVGILDWLVDQGWRDEVFVDFHHQSGIAVGDRFERALIAAVNRCEAVLCLVSRPWLASTWCLRELHLAHRLNKRLFGVLIEDLSIEELPDELTGTWQLVRLASGRDLVTRAAILPVTQQEIAVSFSAEGLTRLRRGLEEAGLDPRHFTWPPVSDPLRPPYRGLRPLEAEDAGIFFGRDAQIVEALDGLRGLRDSAPPRLFVVLGASGSGKSSFLRAGLLPRLDRDRTFLPLPIVRPERAPISGETGILTSLETACARAGMARSRPELTRSLDDGVLGALLADLVEHSRSVGLDGRTMSMPPTLILPIDQAEELYDAEAGQEARDFLALLRHLLDRSEPAVIAAITIRSDSYERLQLSDGPENVRQLIFSLPPMKRSAYAEVVRGPARRLKDTPRRLAIEEGLVDVLLADVETGTAKDALPLLAFTMERLYEEYGDTGELRLSQYHALGGVAGSIEAAVERALAAAIRDPRLPDSRLALLPLLRRGMIPWLAGIDPDTGLPRRRVARLSEIPDEARPLVGHLVDQRLLVTEALTGDTSVEPAHEALLRQWSLLQGWLAEDAGLLGVVETVRRASRDWEASGRREAWLGHATDRLAAAERLSARPDLAGSLEPRDRAYLAACRSAEQTARRRRRLSRSLTYGLLLGIIAGLVLWMNQEAVREQINWVWTMRPYMVAHVRPFVLTTAAEHDLVQGTGFQECDHTCPQMVVVPAGRFLMGSPNDETGRVRNEGPQHEVAIGQAFALSAYPVTFDEWDVCEVVGGCRHVTDAGFGRGTRPVVGVTWDDAQGYVRWLTRMTDRPYRLPSEAEWEYAARAGTAQTYWWGNELGIGNANCIVCGTAWDNKSTSPVGSFAPNPFGLYDTTGNVWQWVQDCVHPSYEGAPTDGSAWESSGDCSLRVDRGGSWVSQISNMRIAYRGTYPTTNSNYSLGIRVARTLNQSHSGK